MAATLCLRPLLFTAAWIFDVSKVLKEPKVRIRPEMCLCCAAQAELVKANILQGRYAPDATSPAVGRIEITWPVRPCPCHAGLGGRQGRLRLKQRRTASRWSGWTDSQVDLVGDARIRKRLGTCALGRGPTVRGCHCMCPRDESPRQCGEEKVSLA